MTEADLMLAGILIGLILIAPTLIDLVREAVRTFDENEND